MSSNPFSTDGGICLAVRRGRQIAKVSKADGNGFQSNDHSSDEARFLDQMVEVRRRLKLK